MLRGGAFLFPDSRHLARGKNDGNMAVGTHLDQLGSPCGCHTPVRHDEVAGAGLVNAVPPSGSPAPTHLDVGGLQGRSLGRGSKTLPRAVRLHVLSVLRRGVGVVAEGRGLLGVGGDWDGGGGGHDDGDAGHVRGHLDQLVRASRPPGDNEPPGVGGQGGVGEGHGGGADELQALGCGGDHRTEDGVHLSPLELWCYEIHILTVPAIPLVAVDGQLEFLRVRQFHCFALVWVQVLDIPAIIRKEELSSLYCSNEGRRQWYFFMRNLSSRMRRIKFLMKETTSISTVAIWES